MAKQISQVTSQPNPRQKRMEVEVIHYTGTEETAMEKKDF